MGMNGDTFEPERQSPAETPAGEGSEETAEDLEDRLIAALERSEQLESRLAECERRITELAASRAVLQPGNTEHSSNPLDTTPAPAPDRQPDTPPRAHTKPADWWFRKFGE